MTRVAVSLTVALLLAACSHQSPPDTASAPKVTAGPAPLTQERLVAVMAPECILGEEVMAEVGPVAAALIASVGGAVIDKGIDFVASSIRKAGEKDTTSVTDHRSLHFHRAMTKGKVFTANPALSCLIVAHGRIANAVDSGAALTGVFAGNNGKAIRKAGINLAANPSFYMEAKFVPQKEGKGPQAVYRYQPVFVSYGANIKKSDWSSGERDLVVSLTFATPTADGAGKVFTTGRMVLPKMKPPVVSTGGELLRLGATDWMVGTEGDAVSTAQLAEAEKAAASSKTLTEEKRLLSGVEDFIEAERKKEGGSLSAKGESDLRAAFANDVRIAKLKQDIATIKAAETAKSVEQKMALAKLRDHQRPAQTKEAELQLRRLVDVETKQREIATLSRPCKPADVECRSKAIDKALEALKATPTVDFDATPTVMAVTVSETRSASKFLLALADILDSSKDGLKTVAKGRLPKAEDHSGDEAATRAGEDLLAAAVKATGDYKVAVAERDALAATADAVAVVKADNAVEQAKLAADTARRRAGLAPL